MDSVRALIPTLLMAGTGVMAQVTGVQVVGSSNTQTILTYQAPGAEACTVAVSERADFRTLVHDLNPALFEGANLDSRPGGVVNGRGRIFIAGARTVEKGRDGQWYSRALQADTVHHYRIQCGAATVSGNFRTATIPLNQGPGFPLPQDPETGDVRWPSTSTTDRTQTVIDPNTGALIRRVTTAADVPGEVQVRGKRFSRAVGAEWTNATAALAADGNAARSGGTGWLALTDGQVPVGTPAYLLSLGVNSVVVRIRGSASGSRNVQVCLTVDGSTCHGEMRTVVLDSDVSTKSVGSLDGIDTWGGVLWTHDVATANFGVMVRAAAGVTVNLDGVEFDVVTGDNLGQVSAGNFAVCQNSLSNGGYRCLLPGSGGAGANWLYWVNPASGEVRFLGIMLATGWGGGAIYCRENNAIWDTNDPNATYCAGYSNNALVLLRGQYTGGDRAVAAGALAPFTWTNLSPGGALFDEIRRFDNTFDAGRFACLLETAVGSNLILSCTIGGQGTIGYAVVFDAGNGRPLGQGGTGRVVALMKTFNSGAMRWCGLHAIEPVGNINWIGVTPRPLGGEFPVTLTSALPVGSRVTIQVSGEPAFQAAQPGDAFLVESTGETIRIASKNSATEWVVERRAGTNGLAANAGTRLLATCSSYFLPSNGAPQIYWDFANDPRATDTGNRTAVVERVFSGTHMVNRGEFRILPDWEKGFNVLTPGLPNTFNRNPSYSIVANPRFNGVRGEAGVGQNNDGFGDAYETHPSYGNFNAPTPGGRNWFVDIHPFIGAGQFGSSLTAVPGVAQTYRVTVPPLQRPAYPTFARCGARQLKEVAGPITGEPYTFCVGSRCRPNAQENDVFVSCPAPVTAQSVCSRSFFGDPTTVCVGPMLSGTQAMVQYFLDSRGNRARTLTNGLATWHNNRTFRILDSPVPLPDGSWILFPSFGSNARRDFYMVKVPSAPAGTQEPAVPPLEVTVAPQGGSVAAFLEFGRTSSLGSQTGSVACSSNQPECRLSLAGRSGELLFYRVVYRNSAGVLERGPIQVQVVNGVRGAGVTPAFQAAQVVNAASQERRMAPGSFVTLFGESLASCEEAAAAFPLPRQLCEAEVRVNGQAAPLVYVSASQINFLMPRNVSAGQAVTLLVSRGDDSSAAVTIPGASVTDVAPAIFPYQLSTGPLRAVMLNSDNSINGPEDAGGGLRGLRRNEVAALFANGLGTTEPVVNVGEQTPAEPLARARTPVEVVINNVRQTVLFAGLAPLGGGHFQINFMLDPATPIEPEGRNRIWLRQGGAESPQLAVSLDPRER